MEVKLCLPFTNMGLNCLFQMSLMSCPLKGSGYQINILLHCLKLVGKLIILSGRQSKTRCWGGLTFNPLYIRLKEFKVRGEGACS